METTFQRGEIGNKLIRVLFFTLIISVMNATMFTIVLPTISGEFSLTTSQVSWITTGYMIVYAIGAVTYGKLADQYKLKDLMTFGLLFMTIGSVLGLVASEYWMIILGRLLQSAGASVIPATVMIVPIRYFSPEKRGRALGVIASGMALGTAIGPIVAGFATTFFSWRFLFLISLLVLFTLPFYRRYLDDEKGEPKQIDFLGGALLAGATSIFLLGVTYGAWLLFLISLILLLLFMHRIKTISEPFVNPAIFKNRNYTIGIIVALIGTAVGFGVPFIMPLLLTEINGISPGMIGFIMFPSAIISALLGKTGGKLADSKGNSFLFYFAASLAIISVVIISVIVGLSPYLILFALIFGAVGQTFMQIAMSNTVSQSLSKEYVGVGMGMFQMLNFIIGATAMTLYGKYLDIKPVLGQLNPLLITEKGLLYSNIFIILCLGLAFNVLLFYKTIGSPKTKTQKKSTLEA